MPLIFELWGDGHPNAGAALTFHYFGCADEANFYQLAAEAMGYSSIEVKADQLEVLAKDSHRWLKKYGIIDETKYELIDVWEAARRAQLIKIGGPFQVQYRTAGIGGKWLDAREGEFSDWEQASELRGKLEAIFAAGGTEYQVLDRKTGEPV